MSLLEDASDDHIATQIAANLAGPILCARAAIPLLKLAGGGHIVNISSRSVELARPYLAVYSATKGGLETFSRTLAAELRPIGIKVSAIRVGPVASEPEVQAGDSGTASVTDEWVKRGGPAPEPPSPPDAVADVATQTVRAFTDSLSELRGHGIMRTFDDEDDEDQADDE